MTAGQRWSQGHKARSQGQAVRTQRASFLKKKKVFVQKYRKFFAKTKRSPTKKKVFRRAPRRRKNDHDLGPFSTNQKIELSSVEDRAFSRTCRLRGQGQGLQNVSSRTFLRTPSLLLDVDSLQNDDINHSPILYVHNLTLVLKRHVKQGCSQLLKY